jgi:membrane protein DedA with SNARE-associated domain
MDGDLKGIAEAVIAFVREHRTWAPPLVMLLAFGESIAFVSLILPFWGMLVALGLMIGGINSPEFWLILTCAAIGAALGDWVSYWLGQHYHVQIAKMWPLNRNPDLLPKGRVFFQKWGPWAIVLGRFSGPLRASVPIVAGAVQMPQAMFQFANWTSAFLWAFVLLVFGDGIGRAWEMSIKALGIG